MTVAGDTDAGEAVDVPLGDGRSLGATVRGTGSPTVVFEAGMGSPQGAWGLVAPAVARHTRTVTYDRAGFGASTADRQPRTVARAAADLRALLRQLGEGPAVLVAHSYGGPIVRRAAADDPPAVAGLVLVDQTDEGCDLYFTDAMERQQRMFARMLPGLGRVGVIRLAAALSARPMPRDARRAFATAAGSPAAARAHAAEAAGCDADLRLLRDDPPPPAEVPVTLLSGGQVPRGKQARARRACLVAAHERRAAASPQGRHVVAERSAHMIPFTEPDLVADEVLRVVEAVRSATPG